MNDHRVTPGLEPVSALIRGLLAAGKMLLGFSCLLCTIAYSAEEKDQPPAATEENATKKTANDTPLELSKFEVTTTQDRGFIYNNSTGAFRTNQPLLDIPQVDVVVTRDMLDAIRFTDSAQILSYLGMVPSYEGEQAISRGVGMLPFQDDVPMGGIPYSDAGVIDNYEVIKGAAQVLYLSNSLAGLVVKNTKKPLSYNQREIQISVNDRGSYRAMLDFTGPLGQLGGENGVKLSYRLIGIYRDDNDYYVNLDHKHKILMPQIKVDFANTSIRAYYQRSNLLRSPNQSALLQPDGEVSIPPTGRAHANRLTKNSMERHDSNMGFISIETQLSENWSNRFKGSFRHSRRLGSNPLALYANWDTRQVGYITRKLDLPSSAEIIMDDIQGKYDLGPTEHISSFGFIKADTVFWNSIWGAPTLPDNSVWKNVVWLPIDDPQNLIESDTYAAPPLDAHDGTKVNNAQSRQSTKTTLAYYAHSVNITKYLTITGGVSWAQQEVTGIQNINVRPLVMTTPTLQSEKLHRIGIVLKPTKDISIYALESTTFNAASGGGQVLADGTFPPNPIGKNREFGLKTALFDGKLTANLSFFEMSLTGSVKLGGIRDDGSIYYVPVPGNAEESTGWDANIAVSPFPGLQVLASYSDVDSAFYTKQPQQTWSVFADYKFPKHSRLAGLSLGGGTSHVNGTYVPLSGTYTYAGTTEFEKTTGIKKINDTGTPVKLYFAYKYGEHWRFNLSIDNLFDEVYAFGGIGGLHTVLDMGMPRTFTFESTYRF